MTQMSAEMQQLDFITAVHRPPHCDQLHLNHLSLNRESKDDMLGGELLRC